MSETKTTKASKTLREELRETIYSSLPTPNNSNIGHEMGDKNRNNLNLLKQTNRTPWLDSRGNELPTKELKAISSNWTKSEWESYLKYFDTPLREKLFVSAQQKKHLAGTTSTEYLLDSLQQESLSSPIIESTIRRILRLHLSKREQEVIWLKYWEGRTQREIAQSLLVSRRAVRTFLKRALLKIEGKIFLNSLKRSKAFKDLGSTGA